ncbi:Tol-Pal system protein TolB [Frankliniella fusca]|uniref:Tol-Pal system protein TolB n=1 Tax=Frankliniella fusca TaxID=407009 RepID=A0AAE1GX95_9NEOP|nr:Tol-Pal system protein TolB [Frankliniella fusca]
MMGIKFSSKTCALCISSSVTPSHNIVHLLTSSCKSFGRSSSSPIWGKDGSVLYSTSSNVTVSLLITFTNAH